ncbi:MAG TPA: DUF6677 family protein [Tepidisphaeraceae bacterium]|jgi:hypothetical protein|nr:DUF6677 family protein [Tepidisphaeraceae bacterium]
MSDTRPQSPALVAVAGWILPGLGYWLIGHRARAVTVCITILSLFTLGLLVAGIRSVDVPGYNDDGKLTLVPSTDQPAITAHPISEILNKPWYIGQILAGPITILCSDYSINLSKPLPDNPDVSPAAKAHVRVAEIGTLYSAVAGMLNLLVIIDAAHRANRSNSEKAPA